MEGLIPYIIKSSSILFILYGYYWLFLRKQTFFTINRFYLLISLFLGMTLPFVSIEVTGPMLNTAGKFHPVAYMNHFLDEVNTNANDTAAPFTSQQLYSASLFLAYMAGVLFFFIRYLIALSQIILLVRRNPQTSIDGIHIVKLKEQQPLFSFFNYLFVSRLPDSKEDCRRIFEHEKKHIRQGHSFDLLITEFACITNWFNPLVWLFKNAILENHEYIADRQVIRRYHTGGYPELLIRQTFKGCFSFTNYFACSKLKKRIMMMTKKQTSKFQVIRYIPAFVLSGILFYGLCCNIQVKAAEFTMPEIPEIQQRPQPPKDTVTSVSNDKDTQAPVFTEYGGNTFKWINANLKYPEKAIKEKKSGRVFVNFIIDEEGNVTNPRIIRGADPELDAEALKVVQKMPKWKPGLDKDGNPVKVSFNIPITFKLQDNGTPAKVKAPEKATIIKDK